MGSIINKSVEVSVGLIIVASMIPIGLTQIANANLSGTDATVATVFTILLPVLVIVSIVLYFVPRGKN